MSNTLRRHRGQRVAVAWLCAALALAATAAPLAAQSIEWRSVGPLGGNVLSLSTVPASAGVVWAGLRDAGVWKSIDGGSSWVRTPLVASGLSMIVAADPFDPLTVYAGTSAGLARSTDGGTTWTLTPTADPVVGLAVAPSAKGVLYLATARFLYSGFVVWKSVDGGATLTPTGTTTTGIPAIFVAMAVEAADANRVYATPSLYLPDPPGFPPDFFATSDGGVTWTDLAGPTFFPGPMIADPQRAGTLYVAVQGGVAISTDRGVTWNLASGLEQSADSGGVSLALDPTSGALYAGIEVINSQPTQAIGQIWKSLDRGATWTQVLQSADVPQSLAVDGVSGRVYAGTDGAGVLVSGDAGAHWQVSNQGMAAAGVVDLAPDAHAPAGTLYLGSADPSGEWKTADGGATWARLGPILNDYLGRPLPVDRLVADSGVLYAGVQGRLFKSADGGQTWQSSSPTRPLDTVADILIDPFQANRLFAAGTGSSSYAGSILRSVDAGNTWAPVPGLTGSTPDGAAAEFDSLLADTLVPGQILAGGRQGLWFTPDGGNSWSRLTTNLPPGQAILRLRRDPARIVYAVLEPGAHTLYSSADNGTTWAAIDGGLPTGSPVRDMLPDTDVYVFAVTRSSMNPGADDKPHRRPPNEEEGFRTSYSKTTLQYPQGGVIYAGTDAGFFVSPDGGAHWTAQNSGLSDPRITRLAADPAHPGSLYAGTPSGLFTFSTAASACTASDTVLCLGGGRFAAQVSWTLGGGVAGYGHAVALADGSGAFWFFGQTELDVMVKIVDGSTVNGHFWVFCGGLTDVIFKLSVTDTATGATRDYTNPAGTLASFADVWAFGVTGATADAARTASPRPAPAPSPRKAPGTAVLARSGPPASTAAWWRAGAAASRPTAPAASSPAAALPHSPVMAAASSGTCAASATTLCVEASRFQIRVAWQLPGVVSTAAMAMPLLQDTGAFWFFSAESAELMVKVVDGRPVNGHFWVFIAGLSDVAYTVTVVDTATGTSKQYVNSAGTLLSRADTAF